MTEFEQQVAEALARPMEGAYLPAHGIALMLAPRVAAAIHGLALDYASTVEGEWGSDDPADIKARCKEYEATALAALRGET